jgi:hypothetical protein
MTLIPVTAVVIPRRMKVSRNEKVTFWLSLKMKMARLSTIMKGSGCILSSEASGMTTSTQPALLITGPLQVPLFVTSSKSISTSLRWVMEGRGIVKEELPQLEAVLMG